MNTFSLPFSGVGLAIREAWFGAGSGAIWLDNVVCQPNDTSLMECQHNDWGQTNCGHWEDAGVICIGNNPVFTLTLWEFVYYFRHKYIKIL